MRLLAIFLLFSLVSFPHFAAALPFGKKEIIIRKLLPPEASIGGVERIAVMPIKKDETNQLAPALSRYLAEAGDFHLLAAGQVAGPLAAAQIDANTFQEVGRLLDVEAVLHSSVHIFKINDSEHQEEIRISYQEEYYDKKNEKWKKPTRIRVDPIKLQRQRRFFPLHPTGRSGEPGAFRRRRHRSRSVC